MIINIRGTNGSGKTTLARSFMNDTSKVITLTDYDAPTKKDLSRKKKVTGVHSTVPGLGTVLCVGSYAAAQGGLDTVPSFALQQEAVWEAHDWADFVICEGILASTVAGSWLDFFVKLKCDDAQERRTVIGYLDTPLDVCLQRITDRQIRAGKVRPVNVDQIRDKVASIAATRPKFDAAGIETLTLPYLNAEYILLKTMKGEA